MPKSNIASAKECNWSKKMTQGQAIESYTLHEKVFSFNWRMQQYLFAHDLESRHVHHGYLHKC